MKRERVLTHGATARELKMEHIVELACVGPRGGFRGGNDLTIAEALRLRRRLAHAVDELIGRFEREMREAQEEKE